ncbi:hypothetical protein AB0M46_41140 [Dactylosporangium sp. NPDC051485]|uniref:hypothetical protein n=1 Tax=Dactylosporangium sp. NPDC051485 TaxID=3154846 RepID=UPI00341880EB
MTDAVPADDGPDPARPDGCVLSVPAVCDPDDAEVVPAALRHLRDVARHTCRTVAVNGFYPPALAVAVIVDTTAALAELAHQVAPYVGDFWPSAGARVADAQAALVEARGNLDAARHHVTLVPVADQDLAAAAG